MVNKLKQNTNDEPLSKPLHVTLPAAAYDALKEEAEAEGKDMSRVVRNLIAGYLASKGHDINIVKVQRGGVREKRQK